MSDDRVVIRKMIEYCLDIQFLLEKYKNDFSVYESDISFQYSCNMCIIQLGELVNRLSDKCIENNQNIPWHAIRAMRNLHAHDYENVDLEIVWNTLQEDIPLLKEQLSEIFCEK